MSLNSVFFCVCIHIHIYEAIYQTRCTYHFQHRSEIRTLICSKLSPSLPTMSEVLRNLYQGSDRYHGIGFALLAGFSFSLSNFLQKVIILSQHHPVLIGFIYSGIALVLLLPAFLVARDCPVPDPEEKAYVALATILQAVDFLFSTFSLTFVPVFNTSILSDTSVLFSSIFAFIFLKEHIGFIELILLLFAFTGICLIAVSGFLFHDPIFANPYNPIYGSLLAICGAISFSATVCTLRKIQLTNAKTILWYIFCVLFLGNFVVGMGMEVIHFNTNMKEFGFLVAIAILNLTMFFCQVKALRMETCLTANLAFDIDSPISLLLQIIFLNTYPGEYEIIGAVLIVTSIVLLTFKKYIYKAIDALMCSNCYEERRSLVSAT